MTLPPEDLRRDRLEPLLKKLNLPVRHLRVSAPVDMLRRVTLVDTPGLGEVFRDFEGTVRDYLDQADTIIYVLSSTSPLSDTEREFLLSGVAPRQFAKIFVVLNAMDVFATADEERRVLSAVRDKVNRVLPGAAVYGISALDEWSRVSGGARPHPERADALAASFAAFRNDLDAAIQFRQRYYVLDRALSAFVDTVEAVENRTIGLEETLGHDQKQLEEAVRVLEQSKERKSKEFVQAAEALERGFEKLRREAEGWMSQFIDRIQNELLASLGSTKTSQIRRHLPFFLKDRLRRAIESCVLAHEAAITELMQQYAAGIEGYASAALRMNQAANQAVPVAEVRWNALLTVELIAQLLGVGELIKIGLGFWAKQRAEASGAEVAQAVANSLPQLREDVRSQVRECYTLMKQRMTEECARRHEEYVKGQLEDLKRAVQLCESGGQRVDDARTRLAGVRHLIHETREFLDQFRPKVWSGIELNAAAAQPE